MKWEAELFSEFHDRVQLQAYPLKGVVLMRRKEYLSQWGGWGEWVIVHNLVTWNLWSYEECRDAVLRFEGKYQVIQERETTTMTPKESFDMGVASAQLWGIFLVPDRAGVEQVMDLAYEIGSWKKPDSTMNMNEFQKGFMRQFYAMNNMSMARRSLQQTRDETNDFG